MKGRVLLLDGTTEPMKAALIVDGRLEDFISDPWRKPAFPNPGQTFPARVTRLIPKVGAAFVQLSSFANGYLRNAAGLREGDTVIVQVTGYPEAGKAFPVTREYLFKSRLLVLTPHAPGVNVSRKIKDTDERDRLSSTIAELLKRPNPDWSELNTQYDGGVIVRSAAMGATEEALNSELWELLMEEDRVRKLVDDIEAATGVHSIGQQPMPVMIASREWTDPIPDKIVAANPLDPGCFSRPVEDPDEWRDIYGSVLPASILELFTGPDLFDDYGVWDEIERLKSPRVDLPSGAWMAVEATRAMVTVDVNTAGEFGGGASLTANLEAARELPRQLRLRGLGGQVTVDFAPLKKADRGRIEDALKTSFRRDPIETTLAGWTPLGNFELRRKRERRPLSELLP